MINEPSEEEMTLDEKILLLILNLKESKKNALAVYNEVKNEKAGGLSMIFADHVFRPGNPKRKNDALKSLRSLDTLYDECIYASQLIHYDLKILNEIADTLEGWEALYKDMVPLIEYEVFSLNPSGIFFAKWVVDGVSSSVAVMSFVSAMLALKKASILTVKTGGIVVLGAIAIYLVINFIGSIAVAEKRMDAFNALKEKVDDEIERLQSEIKDGDEGIIQLRNTINSEFSKLIKLINAGGMSDKNNLSNLEVHDIIKEFDRTLKVINREFVRMVRDIDRVGSPPPEAARRAAILMVAETPLENISDEDIRKQTRNLTKAFHVGYLLHLGKTIEEIGHELGLDPEEVKSLKVRDLIRQGLPPDQILQKVGYSIETIQKMQDLLLVVDKMAEAA